MRPNTIALIWLGGAVLAALFYLIGPWDVMQSVWLTLDRVQYLLGDSIGLLFNQAFDLVRAVALALFAVFIVLAIVASQRGTGAQGVIGITALFIGLIAIGGYQSRLCWLAALLVALTGAIHMSQRLSAGRARSATWAEPERRRRAS